MTREEQKQIADFVRSCIHEIITESGIDKNAHTNEVLRKVADGIEKMDAEPCEDAISRAAAIKAMDDLEQEDIERYSCSIPEGFDGKRAIEALQKLPSVTPTCSEKSNNCTACIIDGTDACSRGAGRAVDGRVCEDFVGEREREGMKKKAAIERQQFVTWYTPEEKLPDGGHYMLVTFSGSVGRSTWYEHAFGVAAYWPDEEIWELETPNYHVDDLVIHAWCDIEPYQGGEWKVDL